ncbi:MAG: TolC family outer membrane protein [Caulobacter sp.]|nr:TolC family outer membrane protein [Caulobacter sp.]
MSKSRRAGLLAAVCSVGLLAGLFSAPAHAETLADAIALAYQTNPTLQGQRASQRALDESVVQARGGLRPSISLSGDASWSDREVTDGDANTPTSRSSGAGLSVSQPLYTGGRVSSGISAARADVLTGREGLRGVEAQVLQTVITAYVDVRRDQERLRIATDNVAVLQRQLDEARARFEVGEITRTDVAQAEARFAGARASFSSAQAQLAISRASYAAVVGQNPGDLAPEPSLEGLLPTTVDEAFVAAEEANPQVLAAEYGERASAARLAATRAERRPTVSASGGIGYNSPGFGGQFENYSDSVSGSVTVRMPIFTGGLINSSVRAATERNRADQLGIEEARRTALRTVSQAWNSLVGARANLIANEEQVRATRIAFEGVRQEAQVGLRTTLDVLNAEQELRNAELAMINARRDEYVASAILLAAMGKLEARYLTPDVPIYDPVLNATRVNASWGWVPWEPVLEVVDRVGGPEISSPPADAPVATAK